jgi:hypothetical protein
LVLWDRQQDQLRLLIQMALRDLLLPLGLLHLLVHLDSLSVAL